MIARDVVGKTIVAVEQKVVPLRKYGRDRAADLAAIVLSDGTRIMFNVRETDFGDYVIESAALKPERRRA